jgi:hypothetical protein
MTNVSKWIWMDGSRKIENQVKYAIACEAEGYLNGINDAGYEPMTREGWINYVKVGLGMMAKDNIRINGEEYKHLNFYGKAKTIALIETYIDNYEAIKPYII